MHIINSHAHLDFTSQKDDGSIVPSVGMQNWDKVATYKNFALGIHPWYIDENMDSDIDNFQALEQKIKDLQLMHKNPIAIGEIGLDFYPNILQKTDKKTQIDIFIQQLDLAQMYNLPAIIHCVKSYDEMYNILKNYNLAVQFHAFNGSYQQGVKLLKLSNIDCYFSFGMYKKSQSLQKFIQKLDENKILIETDEKSCDNLEFVAQEIANLKQITTSDLVKITNQNIKHLFINYQC